MPKSLGQIHTVNFDFADVRTGDRYILDLAGELWKQLEVRVRQGQYFKVVGIDATIEEEGDNSNVGGKLFYYAPTAGRCAAYRSAFKALMDIYKSTGNPVHKNEAYDFRVPFKTDADNLSDFKNQAYIEVDGAGNPKILQLADDPDRGVFTVYNSNIPQLATSSGGGILTPGFQAWDVAGGSGAAWDGVDNEAILAQQPAGGVRRAQLEAEYIPYDLVAQADAVENDFQWRPDPALYLPVLTGQFYLAILNADAAVGDPDLNIAVHVAGWKSIMGDPSKKKRRGKKRGKRKSRRRSRR